MFCVFSMPSLKPGVPSTLTPRLRSACPFQACGLYMWLVTVCWTGGLWWIRALRFCDKSSDADILFMPLTDLYPHNVLSEVYRHQHEVC